MPNYYTACGFLLNNSEKTVIIFIRWFYEKRASYAEIREFEKELHCEIEKIIITDKLSENRTYPFTQPVLMIRINDLR